MMKFYKYHGAGNDFLIADNRDGRYDNFSAGDIVRICNRRTGIGADGVMFLENAGNDDSDFKMVYYNNDGSGGMMCGNGGRCIASFAADLGVGGNGSGLSYRFEAADGIHEAEICDKKSEIRTVRLEMRDVENYGMGGEESYFMNTGTVHFVKFVRDLEHYDVVGEGRRIRYDERFAPAGTNVDFVEVSDSRRAEIGVRTYEKGVEDETPACGTGIVASALAYFAHSKIAGNCSSGTEGKTRLVRSGVIVHAGISDLKVDFIPVLEFSESGEIVYSAEDIRLTGPAEFVGEVCF